MSGKYWITDGREKTYEWREEIKNHGGQWHPGFKCWEADLEENEVGLLREIGLVVQPK
jgi:hypothetical protein